MEPISHLYCLTDQFRYFGGIHFHPNTHQTYQNIRKISFQRYKQTDTRIPLLLSNMLKWSKSLQLLAINDSDMIVQHIEQLSQFNCQFSATLFMKYKDSGNVLPLLQRLRYLKQLRIDFWLQSKEFVSIDAVYFGNLELLENLSLKCSHAYDHPSEVLPILNFEAFGRMKNLKKIYLRTICISSFQYSEQLFTSLEQLDFNMCNISQSSTQMFRSMANLQSITYSNPVPTNQDIVHQQKITLKQYMNFLEEEQVGLKVELDHGAKMSIFEYFEEDVFHALVEQTSLGTVLRSISFSQRQLKEEIKVHRMRIRLAADDLVRALIDPKPPLKTIQIVFLVLSDNSVLSIVDSFPGLEKLFLNQCGVANKGAISIGKLKQLKELDIKSGGINSYIILKLLHNLKELTKLECIVVIRDHWKSHCLKNFTHYKGKMQIERIQFPDKYTNALQRQRERMRYFFR